MADFFSHEYRYLAYVNVKKFTFQFQERSIILRKWSELCTSNKDELAKLLTLENVRKIYVFR